MKPRPGKTMDRRQMLYAPIMLLSGGDNNSVKFMAVENFRHVRKLTLSALLSFQNSFFLRPACMKLY